MKKHILLSICCIISWLSTESVWLSGAAADARFESWLGALRQEAVEKGIGAATLDAALADIAPIPRVVELDRKQPEVKFTFRQYLQRVAPQSRIDRGRRKYREHATLLEEIASKYNVQARFITALWGIETDFGRNTGGFPVIASLATLAYDGRRSAFFRSELLHALKILDEGHIKPDRMIGSWAGAMGQPQFMPSSFHQFAVDYDGDGRRDIWHTPADVFASAANYLRRSGWNNRFTWGREVTLPEGIGPALAKNKTRKPLAAWNNLGVRRADGSALPNVAINARLVLPQSNSRTPAYLVYGNYDVILKWNRSNYFALTVGYLSDAIGRVATP